MKKWILLHRKRHRIRRNLRPMVYTTGWSLTQRQLTNFLFQPHKKNLERGEHLISGDTTLDLNDHFSKTTTKNHSQGIRESKKVRSVQSK